MEEINFRLQKLHIVVNIIDLNIVQPIAPKKKGQQATCIL